MNELIEEVVQHLQVEPIKMHLLFSNEECSISVAGSHLIIENNNLEIEYIISLN